VCDKATFLQCCNSAQNNSVNNANNTPVKISAKRFRFESTEDLQEYGARLHSEIAREMSDVYSAVVKPRLDAFFTGSGLEDSDLCNAKELLFHEYIERMNNCLLDGLARHTHEVARLNYAFTNPRAQGFLRLKVEKLKLAPNGEAARRSGHSSSSTLSLEGGKQASPVRRMRRSVVISYECAGNAKTR
jgi:hypothetical protein